MKEDEKKNSLDLKSEIKNCVYKNKEGKTIDNCQSMRKKFLKFYRDSKE